VKEVTHKGSDCTRLKNINKHRGKFPPVEVEDGGITWKDKEPTPDPEEAIQVAMTQMHEKMDLIIKQQAQMMEMMVAKVQEDKPKAEGSKSSKKKAAKAKAKQGLE
jgi:hypothetical protein